MSHLILILPGLLAVVAFIAFQQRSIRSAYGTIAFDGLALEDAGGAGWQEVVGSLAVDPASAPERASAGDPMLRPLGLSQLETMSVVRSMSGSDKEVTGRTHIGGERHGRRVDLTARRDTSRVRIRGESVARFSVVAEDGRLVAGAGTPEAVRAALDRLAPSERWRGVRVTGGVNGVVVARDDGNVHATLYHDLWLGERLAEAAAA